MFLILQRTSMTNTGTYGMLLDENFLPFLNAIERPWNHNKPCLCNNYPCTCNSSCIPAGIYRCIQDDTSSGRSTYEVIGVKGRTHINFDIANGFKDLKGCIGLGISWGDIKEIRGVYNSKIANKLFMNKLKGIEKFILFVINPNKRMDRIRKGKNKTDRIVFVKDYEW